MRPHTKCKVCKTNPADHKCSNCGAYICDFCEASGPSDQQIFCIDCKSNEDGRRNEWRNLNDL